MNEFYTSLGMSPSEAEALSQCQPPAAPLHMPQQTLTRFRSPAVARAFWRRRLSRVMRVFVFGRMA
jgi:hypothetical protein